MNEKSLEERHKSEEEYHNEKFGDDGSTPAHYNLNPTAALYADMKEMLSNVTDKRILEYGCGNGWMTVELAELGGTIDTFDISSTAVSNTKKRLKELNFDNQCTVKKMSAEELDYNDNSFDIVFGFAILHHLEMDKALSELHRVLKPGGKALFAEPLGGNPIINLYRKFTPQYRTEDEEPINLKDFKEKAKLFPEVSHQEYFFFSLIPLATSNIPGLATISSLIFKSLYKVDTIVLKVVPFIRRFAWYSVIVLKK